MPSVYYQAHINAADAIADHIAVNYGCTPEECASAWGQSVEKINTICDALEADGRISRRNGRLYVVDVTPRGARSPDAP